MLSLLYKGQELPVFACVYLVTSPFYSQAESVLDPTASFERETVWSTGVISRHMFPRSSVTSLSPLAQDWILISLERGPPVSTARGKSAFRHSSPFTPFKGRHLCCFSWNWILGRLFISWSFYPPLPRALRVCEHQTFFAYFVDESPSNRCNLGYRSLTVRAKRMPERTRVDRVVL